MEDDAKADGALLERIAVCIAELDRLLLAVNDVVSGQKGKSIGVSNGLRALLMRMQALKLAALMERPMTELAADAESIHVSLVQIHALASRSRICQHALLALSLAKKLSHRLFSDLNSASETSQLSEQ